MAESYHIDYARVKKPSDERPLTPDEEAEWMKCAIDKEYWMKTYVYIQGVNGRTLFDPRPYQQRVIDGCAENRFTVTLCGRQAGKTTVLGVDALHDVIFGEDFNVGITSYKLTNVNDYLERIKYSYEHLPPWMQPAIKKYNTKEILFTNGCSVTAEVTTETTFRGKSMQRIISDELGFVKPSIANEFMASILPSISAGGENSTTKFNIISTPNGTEGAFPRFWFGALTGDNGFLPIEVKYEEIPDRTEKFEREMRAKIGDDNFDQEYRCVFIGSGGTLIQSRILESISGKDPVETKVLGSGGLLELYKSDIQGRKLAMVSDIGEGIGQDHHCIEILDIETFEQIAEFTENMMNQHEFTKTKLAIMDFLYRAGAEELYYTFEINGVGHGVARLLEASNHPILDWAQLVSETDENGIAKMRSGYFTTNTLKMHGCRQLKNMVENNKISLYSKKLISELKFFTKQGNTYKAESGANDDRCMAMVLMMNLLLELVSYEDRVEEVVNEVDIDDETWGLCSNEYFCSD